MPGAKTTGHFERYRFINDRNTGQVLLCVLDPFANRLRHLACLAQTDSHHACAVADDARINSSTSGLRFCGMMDDPVVTSSARRIYENSRV